MNQNHMSKAVGKHNVKITLTGNFNINTRFPFELFRQATILQINGYVKYKEEDKIEIVAEAERILMENYLQWLVSFSMLPGVNVNVSWSENVFNYVDFRIIH